MKHSIQEEIVKKNIPNEIIMEDIRHLLQEEAGRSVTLIVAGYSMRPFLEHRRDAIELASPHEIKKGDAILAEVAPKRYVFHRVIRKEGEHLTLMGDGNIKGTEECHVKDVIASTKAFIRKGKNYTPEGKVWRTYSWIWLRIRPLRRYILAIYRRL